MHRLHSSKRQEQPQTDETEEFHLGAFELQERSLSPEK